MKRWVANKLGLVNFWYYDEQEFELANGKLLFRGSNGSGKSVTMQSFIPLLLDGNKSPERIDPFGSRSRRIENYLIDEETNEKTAYLYIEFKRQDQEQYLTIGMGMKAVKNKALDSWYFLVNDGRRVGKELMLYREAGEKMPLTKKQLENEMKAGGFFTTAQGEYMKKVNEYLFGFDNIEQYEELLNLLINLRSPKLSKDFKPTEIYKILSNSLKVLSEDDLRPMSEAMENMDSYQGNLESYKRTQNACKNIKYHYDQYNKFKLRQKAQKVVDQQEAIHAHNKQQKEISHKILQIEADYKANQQARDEKEAEYQNATIQYEKLSTCEEIGLQKELLELEEAIHDNQKFVQDKQKQLEIKKDQRLDKENQKREKQGQYETIEGEMKESLEDLEDLAQLCYFEEGELLKAEVLEAPLAYTFDYVELMLEKYLDRIKEIQREVINYEEAVRKRDTVLEEKDGKEKAYLQMKGEAEEANRLVVQGKEDYKVHFVDWQKQAEHMGLAEEEQITLFKEVEVLEEETQLYKIREYLLPFYQKRDSYYKLALERNHEKIQTENQQILELKDMIQQLENAKEIEPERVPEVVGNRQRLAQEGIAFSPFYKVIEFKEETPEAIKKSIESALVSMGLIDALVVNQEDLGQALSFKEKEIDRYIVTHDSKAGYNLSKYLKADSTNLGGIRPETVEQLLKHIDLDEGQLTYINENGEYGLGILKGKALQDYKVKYIGASAREKHRQVLIAQKQQAIYEIEENIKSLEADGENIKRQLAALEVEYKKLPTVEDLRVALVLRAQKERRADQLNEEYIALDQKYFDCQQNCKRLKGELYEKMQGISIPPHREDFEEALEAGNRYRLGLMQLKSLQANLKNAKLLIEAVEEQMMRLEEDIDGLLYDIGQKERELRKQNTKKEALEEVLKTVDMAEIEEQLSYCLKIKQTVPGQLKTLNMTLGTQKQHIYDMKEQLKKLEEDMQGLRETLTGYIQVFEEEYTLGYVVENGYEEVLNACKSLIKDIQIDLSKDEQAYTVALMTALNKNGADLREYGIYTKEIKDRIHILVKLGGKEMGFYSFSGLITQYIEDTKLLISEEERRVFEEVLLNTISSKITSKIYLSKQWIDKINKLMESMQTSSSLKLSLKWVPKKADNEGQLDISELLKLLELGDRCSDEDMRKITDHFGAKVKEGIRNYENTSEARNYHSIIQEVLDYRKWYEFKLFFEKKNERKRELTNNEFFRFSGGEKAMSMYIPLFSAVYARYENAKKDCPRIIAMDEAFAGVDEGNIRDMFRLLEELDLDFMMNSQVLWGDYDTVKDLAISEIIRDQNDTTVLVLNYHWNGMQKVLVDER